MSKHPASYIDSCCILDVAAFSLERQAIIKDFAAKEEHIRFCIKILEAAKNGDLLLKTGSLTVSECQHLDGDYGAEVQRLFRSILTSGKVVKLVTDSIFVAEQARDLRWNHDICLSGADALHVAMAIESECREFVTFDKKIRAYKSKLEKLGLKVILANETTLLPMKYLEVPEEPESEMQLDLFSSFLPPET